MGLKTDHLAILIIGIAITAAVCVWIHLRARKRRWPGEW